MEETVFESVLGSQIWVNSYGSGDSLVMSWWSDVLLKSKSALNICHTSMTHRGVSPTLEYH